LLTGSPLPANEASIGANRAIGATLQGWRGWRNRGATGIADRLIAGDLGHRPDPPVELTAARRA
jgi:hypothetical protein